MHYSEGYKSENFLENIVEQPQDDLMNCLIENEQSEWIYAAHFKLDSESEEYSYPPQYESMSFSMNKPELILQKPPSDPNLPNNNFNKQTVQQSLVLTSKKTTCQTDSLPLMTNSFINDEFNKNAVFIEPLKIYTNPIIQERQNLQPTKFIFSKQLKNKMKYIFTYFKQKFESSDIETLFSIMNSQLNVPLSQIQNQFQQFQLKRDICAQNFQKKFKNISESRRRKDEKLFQMLRTILTQKPFRHKLLLIKQIQEKFKCKITTKQLKRNMTIYPQLEKLFYLGQYSLKTMVKIDQISWSQIQKQKKKMHDSKWKNICNPIIIELQYKIKEKNISAKAQQKIQLPQKDILISKNQARAFPLYQSESNQQKIEKQAQKMVFHQKIDKKANSKSKLRFIKGNSSRKERLTELKNKKKIERRKQKAKKQRMQRAQRRNPL